MTTNTTPSSSSGSLTLKAQPDSMVSVDMDVVADPADNEPTSIYGLLGARRHYGILACVAIASVIVPMTDTIYLPALQMIQDDLSTNQALVAASVAIYMVMVGVFALAWGPAGDRYGRKAVYYASAASFLAATLVCIFAPNIGVLVAFRALQGAAVAAFLTTGSSVIADTFAPEQRGTANGMFMIPLLFGPILGPLIGGAIAEQFGWQSTFIALALLGGLLILLVGLAVPETHQQMVLQRLQVADPDACKRIQEAEQILSEPRVFHAPWIPLKFLIEPEVGPHALVTLITFGSMFASMTEFPVAMAKAPYNLSATMIGVAFLPVGIAGLVGSPIGGIMSDKSAAASGQPEARLINNTLITLLLMPAGLLLFGWSLDYEIHLAVVLVAHFMIGVASAVYLPAIFGYISTIKQSAAGAAAGAVQATMFISAGILIEVSSVVVAAIGFGPFFTILAGLQLIVTAVGYVLTWRKRHAHAQEEAAQQAQADALGATEEA